MTDRLTVRKLEAGYKNPDYPAKIGAHGGHHAAKSSRSVGSFIAKARTYGTKR